MTLGPSVPFSWIICTWQKCADKAVWVIYPSRQEGMSQNVPSTFFPPASTLPILLILLILLFVSVVMAASPFLHFQVVFIPPVQNTTSGIECHHWRKSKQRKDLWRTFFFFPFLEQCRYLYIWHVSCIVWGTVHTYILVWVSILYLNSYLMSVEEPMDINRSSLGKKTVPSTVSSFCFFFHFYVSDFPLLCFYSPCSLWHHQSSAHTSAASFTHVSWLINWLGRFFSCPSPRVNNATALLD